MMTNDQRYIYYVDTVVRYKDHYLYAMTSRTYTIRRQQWLQLVGLVETWDMIYGYDM
ncbi:hypothetical protein LCGC14_2326120 [marine sediment metagenome]|uniref:Uncharacterized protein n=1 Tax=marine sediment metagenome TaxID=412755 RepID=A0A0F9FBB6_9ZZZZ